MSEKTFVEAAAEFSRAMREFQAALAKNLTPAFEDLTVQLNALHRELYLARLKRWIPFLVAALVVGVIVGWWLS